MSIKTQKVIYMKKDMKKKVMAVASAAVLAGAGVAGGFILDNPETIVEEKIINQTIEVPTNLTCPVVEPEVIVEETLIEVPVDNEKLAMVLQYLEDKDVFDDAAEIVRDIEREDEALKLAVAEIEAEFADELEDAELVDDEDDVELVKVYDALDEYELLDADYEDKEFLFKIKAKVDDDEADEKFKVYFEVEVEDGEAKVVDVELVE